MKNNSFNDHVPANDNEQSSDWQQTYNENSEKASPTQNSSTYPDKFTSNGMPIPELLTDQHIGSGIVAGYIGCGGMGDVYKTWNEHVNRFHAVKLLKHGSMPEAEKRFEREIKISATFDHPNIIHVYGAGKWKGYLFLEMEYIDGKAFDELLRLHGPFSPALCTAIGIKVASALHYAHHHSYTLDGKAFTGIIHRDLKPSNIMLASDGRLKLMDFGIAKPVGEDLTSLTMGIVGSWIYLPPEQLDTSSIDFRADIYALGEVLYELLMGKAPFSFKNQREFLNDKLKGNYPPINAATGIPEPLIKIIDRCMKVNPDARFQSAFEIVSELKAVHNRLTSYSPEEILVSFTSGNDHKHAVPDKPSNHRKWILFPKVILTSVAFASIILTVILLFLSRYPEDVFPVNNGVDLDMSSPNVKTLQPIDTLTDEAVNNILVKPPGIPHPLKPAYNQKITSNNVLFSWYKVLSAQSYRIQISNDSSFRNWIIDSSRINDTCLIINRLKFAKSFFWRVRAEKENIVGNWSATHTFSRQNDPLNGTTIDYGTEIIIAIKQNRTTYADSLIRTLSTDDPRKDTLLLRLIEKFITIGKISKAREYLHSISFTDMFAAQLKGRLLLEEKRFSDAYTVFKSALDMETRFKSRQVRTDVIYFKAVAANGTYYTTRSYEAKRTALDSWRNVFDLYKDNRSHPRFIEAVQESNKIAE